MEDNITLDHISTQNKFDLQSLCETDQSLDEPTDSPYDIGNNTCKYYEPAAIKNVISNDLSIFCINAQGLKAHWDNFKNLMLEMGDSDKCFDVIGITEVFSMSKGDCVLPGYHPVEFAVRNDTTRSKGGVALYVNDKLQYKIRPDISIFIPNIFESIFIELIFGKKSIIVGTVYRPNSYPMADLDVFVHNMYDIQNLLNYEKKDVYIMGDINIDLLKFKEHKNTGEYVDNIFSHGFLPLITKPTRLGPHSATLIDHIYTNKQNIDAISGIVITDISDHFGIFSSIKYSKINQNNTNKIKTVRSLSQININKFNNLLQQSDFTPVMESQCASTAYDGFLDIYLTAYEQAFPLKQITLTRKYLKRSPWITKGLVKSSITKSRLLKQKLKHPTNANLEQYSKFCNIYNTLMRKVKYSYYETEFQLAKNNIKRSWTLLKVAINKHECQTPLPDQFKHNNKVLTNPKTIANAFNSFFANIGNELGNNVTPTDQIYTNYLPRPNDKSLFFDPVNVSDVLEIASKIKTKTSCDNNNISTKLLKTSIHNTAVPLTHITNLSLSTGVFPQNMKIARVIPIFKKGDRTLFNNYRPISILPAFSKIVEKIVATKLIKFLESTKQLYKHQYGFRPRHSTIHPVIHLMNQIAEENDKPTKNITMASFLDLSKAFDTISHKILLHKLNNMGIRGVVNSWFRSYLNNRLQYMEILKHKSSLENVVCGVPQGSILGPILFIIYINDIHNSTLLKVLCFADDTTCSFSTSNPINLCNTMNHELELLSQWIRSNKLSLNVGKTKYIVFGPAISRQNLPLQDIYIGNEQIERICHSNRDTSFKFLGLEIDEMLSWNQHIDKICIKLSRANYIINKVKNIIPKSCLLTLYQTLIQCHINYGIVAWGSAKGIERVHKLQKKSLRIINKKPYKYHTEPLFKKCKLLTVKDQYILSSAIFMHSLKLNNLPSSFQELAYFTVPERATRQQNNANQRRTRIKFSSLLPFHKLPQIWNSLSTKQRNIQHQKSFKRKLHIELLAKYSDNIQCRNARCRQCLPN